MSLRGLATFCYRRRRLVALFWVFALVGISALSSGLGTDFSTNFNAPNTESTRASDVLAANFKAQSGDSVQVVMKGTPSMNAPEVQHQAHDFIAALEQVPHVVSVNDPYTPPGQISQSGTVALVNAQLDAKAQDIPSSVGEQMISLAEQHSTPQLEVRLGGQLIQQSERGSLSGEAIGLLAAVVILLIAFGSLLAMAVPIVVALAGIAVGLPIIGLLTHVYPLQTFATTLATMIGIGVGIDYALFVVTRYRQGLQAGLVPEEAVVTAIDTSGRAVLFAGMTVIIALLGMLAIGLSFISGLGIGAAAVVAVTVCRGAHVVARGARLRRHEHRQVAVALAARRGRWDTRDHLASVESLRPAPRGARHNRGAPDRAASRDARVVDAARVRRRGQRPDRITDS